MRTDPLSRSQSRSRRARGARGETARGARAAVSGARRGPAHRRLAATAGAGVAALVLSACSALGIGDDDATGAADSGPSATVGVPTVLVLDASASMLGDDAPGPRIDAAKAAAQGLIEALPGEAILGLVTYGTATDDAPESQEAGCRDVTTLAQPAALDAEGHREALTAEVDGLVPRGYTPIAESLRQAAGLLPSGDTAIIVISDGEDSCGDPPCEAAADLKQQNPGLRISTVGFKTATPELSCIASRTDGLFVTADDADQLATRLLAAREVDQNAAVLTPTGLGGIDIGAHFDDIRAAHGDFPGQSDGVSEGQYTVITYIDCDYVFDSDGIVVEIRPHGGRTVDGLAVGDPVSRAVELYGDEVDAPSDSSDPADVDVQYFVASREAGTAWKIASDGDRITGLVLCRCLPGTGEKIRGGAGTSGPSVTMSGDTEIITYRPFLDDGSLAPGFAVTEGESTAWNCRPEGEEWYTCGRAFTGGGLSFCSTNGSAAWCPDPAGGVEPAFVRQPLVEVTEGGMSASDFPGPMPVYVELADGDICRFMHQLGNGRSDAREYYICTTGLDNWLWAPYGSDLFVTGGGTWTARRGLSGDYGPLQPVQVARAVFFE